jgi:periplasmic protein TonB
VATPEEKVNRSPLTDVIGHLPHDYESNILKKSASDELNSDTEKNLPFDDIIFKNRNQEYGAYVLRKGYLENVYKGLLSALLLAGIVIFSPAIVDFFSKKEVIETVTPRKLVYTELSAPPPIDKPKPPPPQVQIPKLQKVIKFVPPKVVKEAVVDEVPTIQELKQNEVAAVEVDGATDIVFEEPVAEVVEDTDEIFTVVEQQPEFEGGYEVLMNFIIKNMQYPPAARRMGVDGTVHVSFLVSKTGAISEIKVLRGIMAECDKEAMRVVGLMPPWKPGMQNGKPVNVRMIMPLKFRLN